MFDRWLHRKNWPNWWIGVHCTACGKNVFKRKDDYFFLKNKVWKDVCKKGQISTHWILCKRCTERILNRKLQKEDYFNKKDQTCN